MATDKPKAERPDLSDDELELLESVWDKAKQPIEESAESDAEIRKVEQPDLSDEELELLESVWDNANPPFLKRTPNAEKQK